MKCCKLALEDGSVFAGQAFGAEGTCSGEAVFNTAMTGYQEVLTDPSYLGQIVTMTYPLVGNYGINEEDIESGKLYLAGMVIRELPPAHNHHLTHIRQHFLDNGMRPPSCNLSIVINTVRAVVSSCRRVCRVFVCVLVYYVMCGPPKKN